MRYLLGLMFLFFLLALGALPPELDARFGGFLPVAPGSGESANVTLHGEPLSRSGLPGAALNFSLMVRNARAENDTFDLEVAGPASWGPALNLTNLTVAANRSANVTLTATIPADALAGDHTKFTVTAVSRQNASDTGIVIFEAMAEQQVYGLTVSMTPATLTVVQDATATAVLNLTNTGNGVDVVSLSNFWVVWVNLTTTVTVGPGESVLLPVEFSPNPGVRWWLGEHTITFTASSSDGVTAISTTVKVTVDRWIPEAGTHFVQINDIDYFSFNPHNLTITVGDTVRWAWSDTYEAFNIIQVARRGDTTPLTGGFYSGVPSRSGDFSYTFDEPGIYLYTSEPHARFMRGTIVVEDGIVDPEPVSESEPVPEPEPGDDDISALTFLTLITAVVLVAVNHRR